MLPMATRGGAGGASVNSLVLVGFDVKHAKSSSADGRPDGWLRNPAAVAAASSGRVPGESRGAGCRLGAVVVGLDGDGVYCCWMDLEEDDAAAAEVRTELAVDGGAPRAMEPNRPEAEFEMRDTKPASSLAEAGAAAAAVEAVEVVVVVVAAVGAAGNFPFCDELIWFACSRSPQTGVKWMATQARMMGRRPSRSRHVL